MTNVELVDKGVYWVRRNPAQEGGPGEPRLAQFSRMEMSHGEDWTTFYYFGTDDYDMPEDVIVVAGPLDISPPPESKKKEAEK